MFTEKVFLTIFVIFPNAGTTEMSKCKNVNWLRQKEVCNAWKAFIQKSTMFDTNKVYFKQNCLRELSFLVFQNYLTPYSI